VVFPAASLSPGEMLKRREFLASGVWAAGALCAGPLQSEPRSISPVAEPHFPDRLHQFVWRNWELANLSRMAEVVHASPEDILEIGRSMGLSEKPQITADQLRRIYILVIRQNWNLLPVPQLVQLIGWTRGRFEFTLKEDDFLSIKLGPKPDCARVVFAKPGPAERRRAAEIKSSLRAALGSDIDLRGEPAFHFVEALSTRESPVWLEMGTKASQDEVDVCGWHVVVAAGSDADIAASLSEYLQACPSTSPGSEGIVVLRLEPSLARKPEVFRVSVKDARVVLTAGTSRGLQEAVFWLRDQMDRNGGPFLKRGHFERTTALDLRYLYSYFSLYGDPLFEEGIDPFPDGYLEKLARAGVNGVWLHCVLNTMAASRRFPEFGKGCEVRLGNLRTLAKRAKRHGVRVYLYLNEPRAMPLQFYQNHPEIKGAASLGYYAMCTAVPEVRQWISDSLAHIFERVPELGGVFSITMSENLTNCFSQDHPEPCPRCSKREAWKAIGEVLEAIHAGVRRASREADVIVWDWGWPDGMSRNLIPTLSSDTRFLSVSEWAMPIERGGVKTEVGEYSISVVGPGPRAAANWNLARAAGISTVAKVQFNNTWEISAVPYIPVGNLIARHCRNLVRSGVSGLMMSWTLGGYPSPNLEIAKEYLSSPGTEAEVLQRVAARRYGPRAVPLILEAWQGFSEAFEQFPYGVDIYTIPTQHGPANLLRPSATGVKSSMILFPQDDYKGWSGEYPPAVVREQFAKMATLWERALPAFRNALDLVPSARRAAALEDLAIAETCGLHFRSTANQVEFYLLRDGPRRGQTMTRMRELVEQEIDLASRLHRLALQHAVIGFEASNHYYYRPIDLLEKILNCRYLLDQVLTPAG
jgi:hypothetical protein